MATIASTTGANTSAIHQAVIKVQEGGCITKALKAALESQLIIEFPDALGAEGLQDVLSSIAVNQIVSQLVDSSDFALVLQTQLQTSEVVSTIIDTLLASEDFGTAVDTTLDEKLALPETIDSLGTALLANTDFVEGLTQALLNDADVQEFIDDSISTRIEELSLFVCTTDVYPVVAGNAVKVPITPTQPVAGNDYYFDYQVTLYDNAGGGGTNAEGSFIQTRTSNEVTIIFPNALPGDNVTLYHVRINCSV